MTLDEPAHAVVMMPPEPPALDTGEPLMDEPKEQESPELVLLRRISRRLTRLEARLNHLEEARSLSDVELATVQMRLAHMTKAASRRGGDR